jgi:hypothetical protein
MYSTVAVARRAARLSASAASSSWSSPRRISNDRDVMHRDQEDVLVRRPAEQGRPHHRPTRQVEGLPGRAGHAIPQPRLVELAHVLASHDHLRCSGLLHWASGSEREGRAQHRMARDERGERSLQTFHVDGLADPGGEQHVVRVARGRQVVEEPQRLLPVRERMRRLRSRGSRLDHPGEEIGFAATRGFARCRHVRARLRAAGATRQLVDQRVDRRPLEQAHHGDRDPAVRFHPTAQLERHQRVEAQGADGLAGVEPGDVEPQHLRHAGQQVVPQTVDPLRGRRVEDRCAQRRRASTCP